MLASLFCHLPSYADYFLNFSALNDSGAAPEVPEAVRNGVQLH